MSTVIKKDDGFDVVVVEKEESKKGISTATWLVPTIAGVTIIGALGFTYYTVQQRRKQELDQKRFGGYDDSSDLKNVFSSTAESMMSSTWNFFGAIGGKARTYWYKLTGKQEYVP